LGTSINHLEATFGIFPQRWAVEAAYAYERGPWHLGGGLRFSFPKGTSSLPGDIYARGLIKAEIGRWSPAVGPELGLSGQWELGPRRSGLPDDILQTQSPRHTPFYVAMHAMPLRFHFDRYTVSAFEMQLGTTLTPLSAVLRLQVGVLQVGMNL
jgi:hypothetical protein